MFKKLHSYKWKNSNTQDKYYYRKLKRNFYTYDNFTELLNSVKAKRSLRTERKIEISANIVINQSKTGDVKLYYGRNYYLDKCKGFKHLSQLKYKRKIDDIKYSIDLYFYRSYLHFYVKTFNFYEDEKRAKVFNLLYEKYNNGNYIDLKSNYIIDSEDNIIVLIDNDVNFSLVYAKKFNLDFTNKEILKILSQELNKPEIKHNDYALINSL